ncbi:hypothetical protein GCM10020000_33950 [Streptomyces olivoverticillatus]
MPSTTPAPPVTSFTGAFEAHLTVRADAVRLEAHAAAHGLKFTHIVLERGRTPSQPMLTLHRRGPLPAVREAVEDAARALQDAGFEVVRTKIEAAPWVEGVPDTDEEAAVLGPRYYFEHHIKLLIAPGAALPRLAPPPTPPTCPATPAAYAPTAARNGSSPSAAGSSAAAPRKRGCSR